MKQLNNRILAFKSARVITPEELKEIGGGAANGTTSFTTKQTADNHGNWDAGVDVQWD